RVTGVDVAVAEHAAGEALGGLENPLVAFAELRGGRRAPGRKAGAAELVDPQPVGRRDQLAVIRLPRGAAMMLEMSVTVDDLAASRRIRIPPGRGRGVSGSQHEGRGHGSPQEGAPRGKPILARPGDPCLISKIGGPVTHRLSSSGERFSTDARNHTETV